MKTEIEKFKKKINNLIKVFWFAIFLLFLMFWYTNREMFIAKETIKQDHRYKDIDWKFEISKKKHTFKDWKVDICFDTNEKEIKEYYESYNMPITPFWKELIKQEIVVFCK